MRKRLLSVPVEPQPIAQLNTTPLIDVMLVLLVMVILSVPMMSHKVPIQLPAPGPAPAPAPIYRLDLASDGHLMWNGATITEVSLPARLAAVRAQPNAALELSAAGEARYEDYDRILAAVERAGITRLGFAGNERFVADLD